MATRKMDDKATQGMPAAGVDELAVEIGREVAKALERKKMKVTGLHKVTGISRTVIQGYLKGKYKPGAREIRLLSQALDCTPNRLLFGRDDLRPKTTLGELLGDEVQAMSSARLAVLFSHLREDEARALLNLVGLLVEQRVGGPEGFARQIAMADAVGGLVGQRFASNPAALISEDEAVQLNRQFGDEQHQEDQPASGDAGTSHGQEAPRRGRRVR